jgi:hypothetical protein
MRSNSASSILNTLLMYNTALLLQRVLSHARCLKKFEANSMWSSHHITYNDRNTMLTGDMVPCICHPGLGVMTCNFFFFLLSPLTFHRQTDEEVCRKRSVCELRPRGNMPPPPPTAVKLLSTEYKNRSVPNIWNLQFVWNKWDLCSSRPWLWMLFLWNVTSYTLVGRYKRFRGEYYFHLHGWKTVCNQDGVRTFYLRNYTAS